MESAFEPTVQNLIDQKTLRWIFVGGKGGVGKTTTSSSIAVLLANEKKNVLIISTDPAHNLSDCFDQKFAKDPTLVKGFNNLYGLEIDPNIDPNQIKLPSFEGIPQDQATQQFLSEIFSAVPGIDEAMSFAELINTVENMQFDTIVFDTAPTGHTLRLLNFPNLLEKGLNKVVNIKQKLGGIFNQFSGLLGMNNSSDPSTNAVDNIFSKLEKMKTIVEKVNSQMKDPAKTTFVAVCIPEFLSLYETERLIQELAKFKIDIHNIVVNQVLFPEDSCRMCLARQKMQKNYLGQIWELYEDFHVIVMPLLEEEVRGVEKLDRFSKLLLEKKKGNVKE